MSLLGRALGTSARFVPAEELDGVVARDNVVLLDVRTAREVLETGTVPGAVHIHLGELAGRLEELPRDRQILTT